MFENVSKPSSKKNKKSGAKSSQDKIDYIEGEDPLEEAGDAHLTNEE